MLTSNTINCNTKQIQIKLKLKQKQQQQKQIFVHLKGDGFLNLLLENDVIQD